MTSEIRLVANVVTTKEEGIFCIKYLFAVGFTSMSNLNFCVQYVISYCRGTERQK